MHRVLWEQQLWKPSPSLSYLPLSCWHVSFASPQQLALMSPYFHLWNTASGLYISTWQCRVSQQIILYNIDVLCTGPWVHLSLSFLTDTWHFPPVGEHVSIAPSHQWCNTCFILGVGGIPVYSCITALHIFSRYTMVLYLSIPPISTLPYCSSYTHTHTHTHTHIHKHHTHTTHTPQTPHTYTTHIHTYTRNKTHSACHLVIATAETDRQYYIYIYIYIIYIDLFSGTSGY